MATVAVLAAGSVCAGAPARAHVRAVSPEAARNEVAVVTFTVPNESETGSATTGLTVQLPDVTAVYTEAKPGWTARLNTNTAAGTVRSVTWTADSRAGIGRAEFGLFRLSMKLPDADTVSFPAAQQYADGTVVVWDEDPLPDGTEPEHPAAVLKLASGPEVLSRPPENWRTLLAGNGVELLAGAALLVSALAVAVAIRRRPA